MFKVRNTKDLQLPHLKVQPQPPVFLLDSFTLLFAILSDLTSLLPQVSLEPGTPPIME
jgi:hypothetical protein